MISIACLLRAHRMRWGLRQKDLCVLVPQGRNRVSCVERNVRPPNAREILAYGLIFGALPEQLFPGLVADVEETVLCNAYTLYLALETEGSAGAERRRTFLEGILARAVERLGRAAA